MFIKINGESFEYPYTEDKLKKDFPQTSFPADLSNADLSDFGVYPVTEITKPVENYTKIVEEVQPENINGVWTQKWVVRNATTEELLLATQQMVEQYTQAIQKHLDNTARTRNYENIISACSYASGSHPKYSVEGRDCLQWREAVWDKGYEILNDVQAGRRLLPTIQEVINELPPMVWTN